MRLTQKIKYFLSIEYQDCLNKGIPFILLLRASLYLHTVIIETHSTEIQRTFNLPCQNTEKLF